MKEQSMYFIIEASTGEARQFTPLIHGHKASGLLTAEELYYIAQLGNENDIFLEFTLPEYVGYIFYVESYSFPDRTGNSRVALFNLENPADPYMRYVPSGSLEIAGNIFRMLKALL